MTGACQVASGRYSCHVAHLRHLRYLCNPHLLGNFCQSDVLARGVRLDIIPSMSVNSLTEHTMQQTLPYNHCTGCERQ